VAFRAVIDSCALYPFSLRDTLLRFAELELYDVYWSDRILDEMVRHLIDEAGASPEQALHLREQMNRAFDGALVPERKIAKLEPAMGNHEKDRHVLAAAVAIGAEVVITFNTRHFAPEDCSDWGVEALEPDEFLLILFNMNRVGAKRIIEQQAADLDSPPITVEQLLASLETRVPQFVDAVRSLFNQR
jgi:predicted nucleic acid-binding protein